MYKRDFILWQTGIKVHCSRQSELTKIDHIKHTKFCLNVNERIMLDAEDLTYFWKDCEIGKKEKEMRLKHEKKISKMEC